MPASKNKMKYMNEYRKENYRYIPIMFDKKNELHQKMLAHLDSQPSKSEYIRNLILKDLNK